MTPAATPLPTCIYPQRWADDWRGHACKAYNCTTLGHGWKGLTCRCGAHVRKIAAPGLECAVGDEWRALLKMRDVPCFVRPVVTQHSPAQLSEDTVLAVRTYLMEGVPAQILGRSHCTIDSATRALFDRRATCTRINSLLLQAAARLASHDNYWGNFFVPRMGEGAIAGTDGCPIVFGDLNEYNWPRNTNRSKETTSGAGQPWFSAGQHRARARPLGQHWHWSTCDALRPMFPCVGLPPNAEHGVHAPTLSMVCTRASVEAALADPASARPQFDHGSSPGSAICKAVSTNSSSSTTHTS